MEFFPEDYFESVNKANEFNRIVFSKLISSTKEVYSNKNFASLIIYLAQEEYKKFYCLYWETLVSEIRSRTEQILKSELSEFHFSIFDLNNPEHDSLSGDFYKAYSIGLLTPFDRNNLIRAKEQYHLIKNHKIEEKNQLNTVIYESVDKTLFLLGDSSLNYLANINSITRSVYSNEYQFDASNFELLFIDLPSNLKKLLASSLIMSYFREDFNIESKYYILKALSYLFHLLPINNLKCVAKLFDSIIKNKKSDLEDLKLLSVSIGAFEYLTDESKGYFIDNFYKNIINDDFSLTSMQDLVFEVEFVGIQNVPDKYLSSTVKSFVLSYLNYPPPKSISQPLEEDVNPLPFIRKVIMECNPTIFVIFLDFIRNSAEVKSTIIVPAKMERFRSLCTSISKRSDIDKSYLEFLSSITNEVFSF